MSNDQRLVDTNVIVRYLAEDHERHVRIAHRLFAACDRGEVSLVLTSPVLAECVYVLASFYRYSRTNIVEALTTVVTSPGVINDDAGIALDALQRYGQSKAHFVDCFIAATAAARKYKVASFDTDFHQFDDVEVKLEA